MADAPYKRIATPKNAALTRTSVWLGEGHILLVDHVVMHERYRRIFLDDIQAILCWPGKRRQVIRWSLVVVSVLLLLIFAGITDSWLWGLAGLIPGLILMGWNEYRGDGVVVTVVTAVRRQKLDAVRRVADWNRLKTGIEEQRPGIGVWTTGGGDSEAMPPVPPAPPASVHIQPGGASEIRPVTPEAGSQ